MPKIKFCGLRRMQDIEYANHCLPDYAGFVFAPSKRQITPDFAASLREKLDPRIQTVGVFVNQDPEEIVQLQQRGVIDVIQLHGAETEEYLQDLKTRCSAEIIRSVAVGEELPPYTAKADYLLFDSCSPQNGGSGKAFNWNLLKAVQDVHYFLAGGLHCGNLESALSALNPYCVDVSSGIETEGLKDFEKMIRFAQIARKE